MANAKLPVIFVFDLDETIIGESKTLTRQEDIHTFVRSSVKIGKLPPEYKSIPSYKIGHATDIPSGFIRPGFAELIGKIKEYFPTAKLYIYSLGTKAYVQNIIEYVERVSGARFERPLLAREQSVMSDHGKKKSLDTHFPNIFAALTAEFPALAKKENQDFVRAHRLVFLDDNDDIWNNKDKWVQVPHYTYTPTIDVAGLLPLPLRQHQLMRDFLTNTIGNYYVFVEPAEADLASADALAERHMRYHTWMANEYARTLESNKAALKDDFFYKLAKALATVRRSNRPFSEGNLKKIKAMLKPE